MGQEDPYRMMGFYGYASRGSRHLSYALMRQLAHESNLLWVVVGDFNELLGPYEKIGRLPHLLYLCNKFKNALDDCLLQDFGFLGHRFTWEKWCGLHNWVEEHLDRAVALES